MSIPSPSPPRSKPRGCGHRHTSTSRCHGTDTRIHRPRPPPVTAASPSTAVPSTWTRPWHRPWMRAAACEYASTASRRALYIWVDGMVRRLLRGRLHGQRIRYHGRTSRREGTHDTSSCATSTPAPHGWRTRTRGASTACSARCPGGVARDPCGEPRGACRLRRGNRRGYAHRRRLH